MSAAVISIGEKKRGFWSLLEVARPGARPVPYGVLLVDRETDAVAIRTREFSHLDELDEDEYDVLDALTSDLKQKGGEMGGLKLLDWLEDSASNFLRISDRNSIAYTSERVTLDRLFDEHVDDSVQPFVTHLPVYSLRAAATKFGEGSDVEQEGWLRAPEHLRLTEGMFVAHIVGRSMEPRIPDGSDCIFRAPVTGSRAGRLLLIEQFGQSGDSRYTVKRYARRGALREDADREQPIRLEPLNPEFDAFELTADEFRVVAEFVEVLDS